jgi:hypothetical protein
MAAKRMLFDHLVTGGALERNPALSVKAPLHKLGKGKTSVLTAEEAGELLRSELVNLSAHGLRLSSRGGSVPRAGTSSPCQPRRLRAALRARDRDIAHTVAARWRCSTSGAPPAAAAASVSCWCSLCALLHARHMRPRRQTTKEAEAWKRFLKKVAPPLLKWNRGEADRLL